MINESRIKRFCGSIKENNDCFSIKVQIMIQMINHQTLINQVITDTHASTIRSP
jgi:hypothetical protein